MSARRETVGRYEPGEACPKCGARSPAVAYHEHALRGARCDDEVPAAPFDHPPSPEYLRDGEHLHLTCDCCSYEWPRLPLDLSDDEIREAYERHADPSVDAGEIVPER